MSIEDQELFKKMFTVNPLSKPSREIRIMKSQHYLDTVNKEEDMDVTDLVFTNINMNDRIILDPSASITQYTNGYLIIPMPVLKHIVVAELVKNLETTELPSQFIKIYLKDELPDRFKS